VAVPEQTICWDPGLMVRALGGGTTVTDLVVCMPQ